MKNSSNSQQQLPKPAKVEQPRWFIFYECPDGSKVFLYGNGDAGKNLFARARFYTKESASVRYRAERLRKGWKVRRI